MGELVLLSVLGGLFLSLLSVRLQFAIGSFRLPEQKRDDVIPTIATE